MWRSPMAWEAEQEEIGMEGLVAIVEDEFAVCPCGGRVHDKPVHRVRSVSVVTDEAIGFPITELDESFWSFKVWSPEWQRELDLQHHVRRQSQVESAGRVRDRYEALKLHVKTYHLDDARDVTSLADLVRAHETDHDRRVFHPGYRHDPSDWSPKP